VLNGTTPEEVERYHLAVLKAGVASTNEGERAYEEEAATRKSQLERET
jgi:hypothetical protein